MNKKVLKRSFTVTLLGFGLQQGFSQHRLSGSFIDENQKPVAYLEVTARVRDSILGGAVTDSAGAFTINLPQGRYTLRAERFGEKRYERSLVIKGDLDLGLIRMQTDLKLGEIAVSARKRLFEQKADRLVFHVENAIAAAGGDGLDALKITPGLRVENEKISMIGKGSLRVMIDGRLLPLSGADLTSYLQSISADDLKSIEVITTPPARYEAEGNGGLINIIYKKGRKNAWNADLRSTYKQTTYASGSWGGSLNYKKNRLSLAANAYYANGSKRITDKSRFFYPEQIWSSVAPRRVFYEPSTSGRIALDYRWSDRFLTGFQYAGSLSQYRVINKRDQTTLRNRKTGALDSLIVSHSKSSTRAPLHSFDFYTEYKLDSSGKKISLTLDYLHYDNQSDQGYHSETQRAEGTVRPGSVDSGENLGTRRLHNYTAKVDVEYPLKEVQFNFGGKVSSSNTDNALKFYDSSTDIRRSDPRRSNRFAYAEHIQALYLSAQRTFNAKWQAKLGLRLENTQTRGFSYALNQADTRQYSRLFPTAYLTYKPGEDNTFNLSYNRRIRRPSYEFLNPFRTTLNPYSYVEGNPGLQPSYTDELALSFTHAQRWVNTLYCSRLTGGFQQIVTTDPKTDIQQVIPQNYLNTTTFGLRESYTFSPWTGWESMNFFNFSYARNEATFPHVQVNRWQIESYVSTNHTLTLNQAKTAVLNINFWLEFPSRGDLYDMRAYNELDLALKLFFLNKDLQLSLQAHDIFSSNRPLWVAYTHRIRQEYSNYYDRRDFRISLRYRFGNRKIKVAQRDFGNETEEQRAGG